MLNRIYQDTLVSKIAELKLNRMDSRDARRAMKGPSAYRPTGYEDWRSERVNALTLGTVVGDEDADDGR